MKNDPIHILRQHSRKLVRELGMLQLNNADANEVPSYWHTLIEIEKEPDITISKLSQLLIISLPTLSRIVSSLIKDALVTVREGIDKRERFLRVTDKGQNKVHYIDQYSNSKIKRAFHYLTSQDKEQLIESIGKYAAALEQSRTMCEQIKILRLTSSRTLRKQVIQMIEEIQIGEFNIPITPEINAGIMRVEDEYYYNQSCNFWYAVNHQGQIVGCIGLKKLNNKQCELKKFFVTKEYRGLGISQKLLSILLKNAVKHGFEEIYLGTVDVLNAAKRFYEKNGFRSLKKNELPNDFELCPLDTCFYVVKTNALEPQAVAHFPH